MRSHLALSSKRGSEDEDGPSKYANPTTKFGDGFFSARVDARVAREAAISLAPDHGHDDARV